MSDCLFCKIIAGEIPSSKVYEDELCYAFHDIDPQAPMHFLVIPKAHIGSCGEITAENSAVVAHIFEVISKIAEEQSITDFRVVSNCGEQAGQSVHHLHFHVIPRYADGAKIVSWEQLVSEPEEQRAIAASIAAEL